MKKIKIVNTFICLFAIILSESVYAAHFEITSMTNIDLGKSINDKAKALGFKNNNNISKIHIDTDNMGNVHSRFQQTYHGIPIWGEHIIFHSGKDNVLKNVTGRISRDIEKDFGYQKPPRAKFGKQDVIAKLKSLGKKNHVKDSVIHYNNENATLYIYINENNESNLVYEASYFSENESNGSPARPYALIDATTGNIIKVWEGLTKTNGQGPGGNLKVGQRNNTFPVSLVNQICNMSTSTVKTINLNHRTNAATDVDAEYSYDCSSSNPNYNNDFQFINDAYSPLNDVHTYANQTDNMYNSWFATSPLAGTVIAGVHYKTNYENAFWNGVSVNFGDGGSIFYPPVDSNVVSHEIAHGVSERFSGLIYTDQSGGINEAFSDMAGEALEYYLNGTNDWLVGAEITKTVPALRYMNNPPLDGVSIENSANYTTGMDVHYSSGVFNKAFYELAVKVNWNTKKAFEVMYHANRFYWTPNSTFTTAACGAIYSANDLGYTIQDVDDAFSSVGVNCNDFYPLAKSVAPASQTLASFISKGESDYYRIVILTRGTLSVSTSNLSDGDTFGRLYDENHNLIMSNDDSGPDTNGTYLSFLG